MKPTTRENSILSHLFNNYPKRVFLVGAGVSASCGIPVARDLLAESMKLLDKKSPKDAEQVRSLVKYLYPGFDRKEGNYPNIEDFLNLAWMAKQFNNQNFVRSERWDVDRIQKVISTTIKSITELIKIKQKDERKQSSIKSFVNGVIRPGDVIITFNWDTTIESALVNHPTIHRVKERYTGSSEGLDEDVVLMKPHGSVDWEAKIEYHRDQLNRRHPRIFSETPLIVPPLASKDFSLPIFQKIWRSVFEVISDAEEIFILGYSLPQEDQFARFVFRRAIRQNFLDHTKGRKKKVSIQVVNKSASVRETFERVIGKDFTLIEKTFEVYSKELSSL